MVVLYFVGCLIFISKNSQAQKVHAFNSPAFSMDNNFCKSSFKTIFIGKKNPREKIIEYLLSSVTNLKTPNVSLLLSSQTESPGGFHFSFDQLYDNHKIFRGGIKVNMDKSGNIKSVFDFTFTVNETKGNFTFASDFFEKIDLKNLADTLFAESVFFPLEKKLIAALRLEISKNDDYYEMILDNESKEIYRNDLALYYHPLPIPDSIVSGFVFLPDPLTTSNVLYGAPYQDGNNSDIAQINAERKFVSTTAKFDTSASLFRLENTFVKITEHSLPTVAPVTSSVPSFSFTRSQFGFEDFNVFYHLNNFHYYLQTIGFGTMVNFSINADTHALSGQDNSDFIAFPVPHLNFGEGGVDDAEDADVIIHEYCHAVSNNASPNSNTGTERSALDEALGDYFASSYSRSINPFKWENVFSWDGHNEFWNGRMAVTSDHYPEDLKNDLYEDADIWASTMMEIWTDIGRENADALQLEALSGYSAGMKMSDAAQLVIQADSVLNNGLFYYQLCNRFYNRGLINNCEVGLGEKIAEVEFVRLLNSENFALGTGNAVFQFNKPIISFLKVFDINGKLLFTKKLSDTLEFSLSGKEFSEGIYFIKISSGEFEKNFKLVRFKN